MKVKVVCLWLDNDKFGCGWRDYVALIGRKWVRLVMVASGETCRITLTQWQIATSKTRPGVGTRRQVMRRLRRNAQTFGNDKTTAVKEALAALRAEQSEARVLRDAIASLSAVQTPRSAVSGNTFPAIRCAV